MSKKEFNLEREISIIKSVIGMGIFAIGFVMCYGFYLMTSEWIWQALCAVWLIGLFATFIHDAIRDNKWKKEDKVKLESTN